MREIEFKAKKWNLDEVAKVRKLFLSDASAFSWGELSEKEEKAIMDIYTDIDRYMQLEIRKALEERCYYFDSDERFLKFCGEHLDFVKTQQAGSPWNYTIAVSLKGVKRHIIIFDSKAEDTGPFEMGIIFTKREKTLKEKGPEVVR